MSNYHSKKKHNKNLGILQNLNKSFYEYKQNFKEDFRDTSDDVDRFWDKLLNKLTSSKTAFNITMIIIVVLAVLSGIGLAFNKGTIFLEVCASGILIPVAGYLGSMAVGIFIHRVKRLFNTIFHQNGRKNTINSLQKELSQNQTFGVETNSVQQEKSNDSTINSTEILGIRRIESFGERTKRVKRYIPSSKEELEDPKERGRIYRIGRRKFKD